MRYRSRLGSIRWRSRRIRHPGILKSAAAFKTPVNAPTGCFPRQCEANLGCIGCRPVDEHAERSVKVETHLCRYVDSIGASRKRENSSVTPVFIRARKFISDFTQAYMVA